MKYLLMFLCFTAALAAPTYVQALPSVIYVDDDADTGGDGTSWAIAYKYLQDALSDASYGDTICVAGGSYKPDRGQGYTPGNRSATFQLKNGAKMYGGYAGIGSATPDERNIALYQTVLSGDLADNDGPDFANNSENSYHVVRTSHCSSSTLLEGFIVEGGNADGTGAHDDGGGMYNFYGNPAIANCSFTGNYAANGGGMLNFDSDPTLNNCNFDSNAADNGAGVYNSESSPVLVQCSFSANSVSDTDSLGGGIANWDSDAILINCTFTGNIAGGAGGGIYNSLSSSSLTNCSFSDNAAGFGGGIYNWDSSMTVTNCTFTNNAAELTGGGLRNISTNEAEIYNSVFIGNSAQQRGGGVANKESNAIIKGCLFRGNSALYGGGMRNSECSPIIENCSFISNTTIDTGYGGGMGNYESSSTVINCIFVGNSAYNGAGMRNRFSNPLIIDCTFLNNTAEDIGGGVSSYQLGPTLTRCILTGNEAGFWGGGIANSSSDATVTNCILTGNKAKNGGGMYNYEESNSTVTNCTLVGNSARYGNAFACESHYTSYLFGTLAVTNCILLDGGDEIFNYNDSIVTLVHNNIQDGAIENGNIDQAPLFAGYPLEAWRWSHDAVCDTEMLQSTLTDVTAAIYWEPGEMAGMFINPNINQPLQFLIIDNTDTTITVWGDVTEVAHTWDEYEIYDFHLQEGSPCIDEGFRYAHAGEYDLNGNHRHQDADVPSGWKGTMKGIASTQSGQVTVVWKSIDMGSYEHQPSGDLYDTFTVQSCDALDTGTWQDAFTGNVGTWTNTSTAGANKRFYRVYGE